jgi:hypothetical protein
MNNQTLPRFSARKKNKDLMRLLLSTESFQKEVKEFRTKFEIAEDGNRAQGEQERWTAHIIPRMNEYFAELEKLTRSYRHLPKHFDRHVRQYIEQGFVSWPANNFDITPVGWPAHSLKLNVHAKLPNKEREDAFEMLDRMGEHLPSVGTIKNLDELLKSERIYDDCEAYNQSKDREYRATVREYAESAEEETSTKALYEHKRMLDEHRKTKLGKM